MLKDISVTPGMMDSANNLWKMMDEMAANDPEEYDKFLKKQMDAQMKAGGGGVQEQKDKKAEMPLANFCVRMRLEGGCALFANVCQSTRIRAPSATTDGSIPLAVGIPREANHKTATGYAIDVVVNGEVTRRCDADPGYREEVAGLVASCVREAATTLRMQMPLILPGYRALPASDARYVGTPQPFVDARGPPKPKEPDADAAAVEETPEHELLSEAEQLRLVVRVPRVGAVADLDVEIGERLVSLKAEGLYALELPLPQTIRSDDAKCKFEKKKRVLTITMPLELLAELN